MNSVADKNFFGVTFRTEEQKGQPETKPSNNDAKVQGHLVSNGININFHFTVMAM